MRGEMFANAAASPRSATAPVAFQICSVSSGVDLISDVLPFGRLWYDTPDNAVGYAMLSSRSHDALIRVYDDASNLIGTYEHKGNFGEL